VKIFYNNDFLNLTQSHYVTVRFLEEKATLFFDHYVPATHPTKANAGKGISFVCANEWSVEKSANKIFYNMEVDNHCPICQYNSNNGSEIRPRMKYSIVVLDRTPVKVCLSCKRVNHAISNFFTKECIKCKELLPEPTDLNTLKLLVKGPVLFTQLTNIIDIYGDIRKYDVKMMVKGKDLDQQIICIPKAKSKLLLAPILGENWKEQVAELKTYSQPLPNEIINRIFTGGEDYFEVMKEVVLLDANRNSQPII
jgi:hypothetical protein